MPDITMCNGVGCEIKEILFTDTKQHQVSLDNSYFFKLQTKD
jgi:hypothetical protein